MNDKANNRQVGGDHYKAAYQHWDWVADVALPYLPATCSKYLKRWRKKNGLEDLEKSHHYLLKFIEVESAKATVVYAKTDEFIVENEIGAEEASVLKALVNYKFGNLDVLRQAACVIQRMIDAAKHPTQAVL